MRRGVVGWRAKAVGRERVEHAEGADEAGSTSIRLIHEVQILCVQRRVVMPHPGPGPQRAAALTGSAQHQCVSDHGRAAGREIDDEFSTDRRAVRDDERLTEPGQRTAGGHPRVHDPGARHAARVIGDGAGVLVDAQPRTGADIDVDDDVIAAEEQGAGGHEGDARARVGRREHAGAERAVLEHQAGPARG